MMENPRQPEDINPYASPDAGLKSLDKKFRYSLPVKICTSIYTGAIATFMGEMVIGYFLEPTVSPRSDFTPLDVGTFLAGAMVGWWFSSNRLPPSIKPPGWDQKYGEEDDS